MEKSYQPCPTCKGSGAIPTHPGPGTTICNTCNGTGKLVLREQDGKVRVTKRLVEA